ALTSNSCGERPRARGKIGSSDSNATCERRMSKVTGFRCDSCGALKGETNHWWIIEPPISQVWSLSIEPWEDTAAHKAGFEHYCGAACVQKRVALFLSETVEREARQTDAKIPALHGVQGEPVTRP